MTHAMTPESLTELTEALEQAAARLRSGGLDATAAAELVDECAHLATRAGAELDRQSRAALELPLDGAEQLPLDDAPAA